MIKQDNLSYWYLVSCLPFLLLMQFVASSDIAWLKILPILFLLAWSSLQLGTRFSLISLALLFSATGDIFLALDRQQFFLYGLGAFFVAHVMYTLYFYRLPKPATSQLNWRNGMLVITLVSFAWLLSPALAELQIPVYSYIGMIGLMAWFAFNRQAPITLALGATSFLLSDALIAIDTFLQSFAIAQTLIMLTYYLAQFLIVSTLITVKNSAQN